MNLRLAGLWKRKKEGKRAREKEKKKASGRSILFSDFRSRNRNCAVRNQHGATVEFIAVARNCRRTREKEGFSKLRVASNVVFWKDLVNSYAEVKR